MLCEYGPWYGNLSVQFKSKLGRLISTAFKIVGYQEQCYLQSLYEKSVLREAQKILDDPTHILNQELELLPSGRWFRMPNCRLKRYKNYFIPATIKMLNSHKWLLLTCYLLLLYTFTPTVLCTFCVFCDCVCCGWCSEACLYCLYSVYFFCGML